ncbi:MAG: hypothetical protein PHN42_03815 [Bacilli bacterium]|nr:hypothetical protein [Bacilli bacterium]
MNYIYDILLNFNDEPYDFYDWNELDEILHIRRIPLYKINSIDFFNIKNNIIQFDSNFLNEIKNKTEIFINKNIKKIEYSFLITDELEVMAINIKKNNNEYSKLLIDEEIDIIDVSKKMKEKTIDYKIIKEKQKLPLKTRKEIEITNYVNKQLQSIFKEKNIQKLKYLYYEIFNEKITENSLIKIKDEFIFNLNDEKKLYDILKLMHNHK